MRKNMRERKNQFHMNFMAAQRVRDLYTCRWDLWWTIKDRTRNRGRSWGITGGSRGTRRRGICPAACRHLWQGRQIRGRCSPGKIPRRFPPSLGRRRPSTSDRCRRMVHDEAVVIVISRDAGWRLPRRPDRRYSWLLSGNTWYSQIARNIYCILI